MAIIELELKVPQKLKAIKLKQYQEYLKIQKENSYLLGYSCQTILINLHREKQKIVN